MRIALSALGTALSVFFSFARLNQEVARAGLVPFARDEAVAYHFIPSCLLGSSAGSSSYRR